MNKFIILFVCTANVCRSPVAEAILRKYLIETKLDDVARVISAGVMALDGQKASELSRAVAKENGLDISGHRSQSITPDLVKVSDLVLCMTPDHRDELLNYFPDWKERIHTLKGFQRKESVTNEAVDDPIGLSLNFYRRVFKEIQNEIKRILPRIQDDIHQKNIG